MLTIKFVNYINYFYLCKKIKFMYRLHSLKEDYFSHIDSEQKAYILGFFYADGYNNEKTGAIEFSQSEARIDILEQIKLELYTDAEIKKYLNCRAHMLTVCSKQMSKDLVKCGAMQNKAH